MEGELLTSEELAKFLHCEPRTVEDAARAGRLPAVKYGISWIFPKQAVLASLCEEARLEAVSRKQPDIHKSTKAVLVELTPAKVGRRRNAVPRLGEFSQPA